MVVLKEVERMFWAVTLDSGNRYTQTVEKSFHLSNAALEITPESSWPSAVKQNPIVSVMIGYEKAEYLLCSLNHKAVYQQPLDLNFTEGEEVTFFLSGHGTVHLTGYMVEDSQMDDSMELPSDFEEEDSDEDSDEDEAPQLVDGKGTKRKLKADDSLAKKLKWLPEDDDSDEDDEDFELDEDEEDDFSEDDEDWSDLDEESEEKEVDESEEEKIKSPSQKTKKPKDTPKKTASQNDRKQKNQEEKKTPAASDSQPEEGASKKKKKKKKKKKPDSENSTAAGEKQKTVGKEKPTAIKTPKKRVLQGGTILEDLRVGEGEVAKKGKMMHMYYVGKLEKNGKQFDSCTGGKPFRFRLGKGEVIAGWDTGVEGMKVGGKRRLIVPPQQGYGNQRQGPIPAGSTLVFEVELKNVS